MNAETSFPLRRRVSVPTILQMEAVECGAACLAMILAHHGKWVPLEEVRAACGVSRDGSKAKSVAEAARRYGLEAEGWRSEKAQVPDRPLPAILFWDFSHFVVLEGVSREYVYINDPATGPRTVSHAEFSRSFTGVMLTMRPSASFERSGSPPRVWRSVAGLLAGSRGSVAFLVIAGIFALLPGLVAPAAIRIFVDEILIRGLTDWLRPLLVVLATAAVLGGLLAWLQGAVLARLQWKLGLTLGLRLTAHIVRLPSSYFAQRHAGDVASRLHAAEHACDLVGKHVAAAFVGGFATVFFGALMLLYDPILAGIGMVLAFGNVAFIRFISERQMNAARRVQREQASLASLSINGIQSIETLKAMASEEDFFVRWIDGQTRLMNAATQAQGTLQVLGVIPVALGAVTTAGILYVGGFQAMSGTISVGTLAAFQTVLVGFLAQVNGLVGVANGTRELRVAMERIDDVLRYPLDTSVTSEDADESDGRLQRLEGAVSVTDVTYGFSPSSPPCLNGLSLTIAPGARIAIVGPSGSGKTTLARLIVGLADPWTGSILFDGVPRSRLPRSVLSASLAYVDQKSTLFEGSVRDNLTLWDERIGDEAMIEAARDALLHDVIIGRPDGYDGPVSEGGANWSGGQAQRLEIARALASEPSILVLDEATAALDAPGEAAILDNLRRRGCTTILITHRLSAIRSCDEIIVLDRGRIIQRGRHTELGKELGMYAELVRAA